MTEPVQPAAPAAPPAAPVAAPAAPVVPAAPAVPDAIVTPPAAVPAPVQNEGANGTFTFEPTGDAGLDLSLNYFGSLGLSLESPEMIEAGKGNFAYLEAKLAALGDKAKGYENYIQIAKQAHERLESNSKAEVEARKKVVHEAVGGEENWKQIQKYVTENAEPEELEAVKSAIGQGGIVARAVAEMLHRQFTAASGTTVDPANPVRQQATVPQGGAPLTREGYRQEVQALVARIGSHNMDRSPEYAALQRKYAGVVR